MRLLRFLFWMLLLSPVTAAMAQAGIHRCTGANGNPVFTDGACSDMQATPTQPIANAPLSDRAEQPDAPPPILCAANLAQLKQGVADAFAIHDANRLAGLMLWSSFGRGAVLADIRSLSTLMQRPLVDFGDALSDDPAAATSATAGISPAASATSSVPMPTSQLLVRTAVGDGSGVPHETRFAVVRESGCLWLREP